MPAESSRRAELAELVPDHLLRNKHFVEHFSVMHIKGHPDKLRDDRAATRPGANRHPLIGLFGTLYLEEQLFFHKRAFFQASCHNASSSSFSPGPARITI